MNTELRHEVTKPSLLQRAKNAVTGKDKKA